MTCCLLGLASNCDLCIHPGGEISMSGMIIAWPWCACECACVLLCVHMYISVLKNHIILSTGASKTICSNFPFCHDLRWLQDSKYFHSWISASDSQWKKTSQRGVVYRGGTLIMSEESIAEIWLTSCLCLHCLLCHNRMVCNRWCECVWRRGCSKLTTQKKKTTTQLWLLGVSLIVNVACPPAQWFPTRSTYRQDVLLQFPAVLLKIVEKLKKCWLRSD